MIDSYKMRVIDWCNIENEYKRIYNKDINVCTVIPECDHYNWFSTPEYVFGYEPSVEDDTDYEEYKALTEIWTILRKSGITEDSILVYVDF